MNVALGDAGIVLALAASLVAAALAPKSSATQPWA